MCGDRYRLSRFGIVGRRAALVVERSISPWWSAQATAVALADRQNLGRAPGRNRSVRAVMDEATVDEGFSLSLPAKCTVRIAIRIAHFEPLARHAQHRGLVGEAVQAVDRHPGQVM